MLLLSAVLMGMALQVNVYSTIVELFRTII